jgi:hypothetical protein
VRAVPDRVIRCALAVLALTALVSGVWASVAPRGFYDDFPGAGRSWVAPDGPYNEHLVRDFGALNLALATVTIVALLTLGRAVVVAAALAWIAYTVPHVVYHARHRDVFDTVDQVATLGGLALALVLPTIVLVAELQRRARHEP